MAQIRKSFVRETTTTIGVGSVTLAGARSPGRTFASVMANGDTCDYMIVHTSLNEFETGVATFNTGGILARTTVIESSNANSAVNFSAGTKNVDLVVNSTRYNTFDAYATTAVQGQIQLASTVGTLAATDTIRAVTPQGMGILWKSGTDNAGAGTITLGDGGLFNLITSTAAITAFAFTDDAAGRTAKIRFNTARVLTHNATSLVLPVGGANITTEVGDTCTITSLGSGNFIVNDYERFDGRTILGPTDPNVLDFSDDFLDVSITGTIKPWTETTSAAATNSRQVVTDHLGVLRLTTGAISGNNKRLHLGVAVTDAIATPNLLQRFSWVVRIPTALTTRVIRLGFMQDVSASAGGTAGVYFEFDPSLSANWRYVTRQASASTANNALAVIANNWYVLEARRLGSGNWEFWVNGILRATNSATLPSTACNFGALLQTSAASAVNLDVDFGAFRSLAQRFT